MSRSTLCYVVKRDGQYLGWFDDDFVWRAELRFAAFLTRPRAAVLAKDFGGAPCAVAITEMERP